MSHKKWCEHTELTSKYTMVRYFLNDEELLMRVQTWICPECGVHGADTEIVKSERVDKPAGLLVDLQGQ